jgi:hypothetical protein
MNGPADEAIERHTGIGEDVPSTAGFDGTATHPDDETADAAIGHEHVRPAAQHGHRCPGLLRDLQHAKHLVRSPRLNEAVGRATDPEGGEWRQHGPLSYALRAQGLRQRGTK